MATSGNQWCQLRDDTTINKTSLVLIDSSYSAVDTADQSFALQKEGPLWTSSPNVFGEWEMGQLSKAETCTHSPIIFSPS